MEDKKQGHGKIQEAKAKTEDVQDLFRFGNKEAKRRLCIKMHKIIY